METDNTFAEAIEKVEEGCIVSAYMSEVRDKLSQNEGTRPRNRFMTTLYVEHLFITKCVENFERLLARILAAKTPESAVVDVAHLRLLLKLLADCEPHRRREEEILFPVLERHGAGFVSHTMTCEHVNMSQMISDLRRTLRVNGGMLDPKIVRPFQVLSSTLVREVRDHIFEEEHAVYPLALEIVSDSEFKSGIERKSEEIGYCCYVPER